MKCNLGQTEKYVRLMLGIILFAWGMLAERYFWGTVGQLVLWASLFLLLTAAFSWCPCTWLRWRLLKK